MMKNAINTPPKDILKPEILRVSPSSSFLMGLSRFLPSGLIRSEKLLRLAKATITHPETKMTLDDFISNGGTVKMANLKGAIMNYSPESNTIAIDRKSFEKSIKERNFGSIARSFSHELHHYYAIKEAEKTIPGIRNFYCEFEQKSVQIIHQGLEAGQHYNDLVTSFEAGGRQWKSFSHLYPKTSSAILFQLMRHKTRLGNKIPEKLLPGIANVAIISFTGGNLIKFDDYSRGIRYQEDLIRRMAFSNRLGKGQGTVDAGTFFKAINVPTTFSNQLLDLMLLFKYQVIPVLDYFKIPLISVSMAHPITIIEESFIKQELKRNFRWEYPSKPKSKSNIRAIVTQNSLGRTI